MEETEILVFTLISLIENCKEHQLRQITDNTVPRRNTEKLDEAKILKNATKFYKNSHSNASLSSLILNYFNQNH